MRSSIAEARRRLETDVFPIATDFQRRQADEVLSEAEARAEAMAGQRVEQLAREVEELRTVNLRVFTACRDEAAAIRRDLDGGRLAARTASQHLAQVRAAGEGAEERLERAAELVEEVEAIESDPVAFYDRLTSATPRLQRSTRGRHPQRRTW